MPEWVDELLGTGLAAPPADFTARVMAAIEALPVTPRPAAGQRLRAALEWLAVAATVVVGLPQLAMFLFGVWTVSGAG